MSRRGRRKQEAGRSRSRARANNNRADLAINTKVDQVATPVVAPNKKPPTSFSQVFKKLLFIAGALVTLSGLFVFYDQIANAFTPKEKKWDNANYEHGAHIPLHVTNDCQDLQITCGPITQLVPINWLRSGKPVTVKVIFKTFDLSLKLVGNDLYLSHTFREIKSGHVIGKLNFEKWELKNSGINHYHDQDDNMEIIDNNDYVVFRMRYAKPNELKIEGYFIFEPDIYIVKDNIISTFIRTSPDFILNDCLNQINEIAPINTY